MIAVITDDGVGGHFLNWSLHYLAGHSTYYFANSDEIKTLVENPIKAMPLFPDDTTINSNAHGFAANRIITLDNVDTVLPGILSNKSCEFNSVYMHWIRSTEQLPSNTIEQEDRTELKNTIVALEKVLPQTNKVVAVSLPPEMTRYYSCYVSRAPKTRSYRDVTKIITNNNDKWDDFVSYFFADSAKEWSVLDSHTAQRDFLSTRLHPFKYRTIVDLFDRKQDYYQINAVDLWNTFDSTVNDLFSYLGIAIDPERYAKWVAIYSQWRQVHRSQMLFCWYFKTIIDNIINGHSLDLSRFNLDLIQEATIQNYLIYNHSLNFKKQPLLKFTNTKKLHDLLESYTETN